MYDLNKTKNSRLFTFKMDVGNIQIVTVLMYKNLKKIVILFYKIGFLKLIYQCQFKK